MARNSRFSSFFFVSPYLGYVRRKTNIYDVVIALMFMSLILIVFYFGFKRKNYECFEDNKLPFDGLELSNETEIENLLKDKKNVVFVFHKMDTCGHCINFAPKWKEFSENYKQPKNKKVHFKMVDMNDGLSDDVSGFPELRIYKTTKNYVSFSGNRDNNSELEEFIKNNM